MMKRRRMKCVGTHLTLLLLIVLLLLPGCAVTGPADTVVSKPEDPLCFPGLSWDMTREEVMQALELTADDCEETPKYLLKVSRFSCFGRDDAELVCYFTGNDMRMEMCLEWVQVVFPEDADMAAVKAEAEKHFGTADAYLGRNWAMTEAEIYEKYQQTGFPLDKYLTDEHCAYWVSDVSMADYLGADGTAAYIENFTDVMPEKVRLELVESEPAAFACWSDGGFGFSNPTDSQNYLYFDGTRIHQMNHILAQLPKSG